MSSPFDSVQAFLTGCWNPIVLEEWQFATRVAPNTRAFAKMNKTIVKMNKLIGKTNGAFYIDR